MPRKPPKTRNVDPNRIPDEPAVVVQGRRNLTFLKCVATIETLEGEGLTPEEFVAFALTIAHDNPEALIHCSLTVWPKNKTPETA
jgi:hypothetical protein